MDYATFKKKVRNLEAGVPLCYYKGNLSRRRMYDAELNRIAKFCKAVFELELGQLFQRRNNEGEIEYEVRLHEKLGMRKDGTGTMQECERVGDAMQTMVV